MPASVINIHICILSEHPLLSRFRQYFYSLTNDISYHSRRNKPGQVVTQVFSFSKYVLLKISWCLLLVHMWPICKKWVVYRLRTSWENGQYALYGLIIAIFFCRCWCFQASGNIMWRPAMGSTPQFYSEMTYHLIVIIRFFANLFSKWPLAAILDFTYLKKWFWK